MAELLAGCMVCVMQPANHTTIQPSNNTILCLGILYMKRGKIPKILRGYFKAKINDLKKASFKRKPSFTHQTAS
jgi:hypothetical protein